jgi:integrase
MVNLAVVPEIVDGKRRYKIAGYYVHGKRVRKYFPTRGEAQTFVRLEQTRRHNLGARAARIDGALAEDALRGLETLQGTPFNLLDAARAVAEAHAKLKPFSLTIAEVVEHAIASAKQQQESVTVRDLAEKLIANRKAKRRRPSHIRDLETRLGRFAAAMGNRVVAEIRAAEVDEWIQSLGVGPQTQNNFRTVLNSLWNFAIKHQHATENIIRNIEKVSITRTAIPVFTADEVARLLAAAPVGFLPYLAIGVFAGVRPEEIARLCWEDFDFDETTIAVNAHASKIRKKRFAEITPNLAEWLAPYRGQSGAVVPPNLQKLRRTTMEAAGIKLWPQDVLRHTFASNHYAHFRNPALTALLLGHRDQAMLLNHYRGLVKPSQAARFWNLRPSSSANIITLMNR